MEGCEVVFSKLSIYSFLICNILSVMAPTPTRMDRRSPFIGMQFIDRSSVWCSQPLRFPHRSSVYCLAQSALVIEHRPISEALYRNEGGNGSGSGLSKILSGGRSLVESLGSQRKLKGETFRFRRWMDLTLSTLPPLTHSSGCRVMGPPYHHYQHHSWHLSMHIIAFSTYRFRVAARVR